MLGLDKVIHGLRTLENPQTCIEQKVFEKPMHYDKTCIEELLDLWASSVLCMSDVRSKNLLKMAMWTFKT